MCTYVCVYKYVWNFTTEPFNILFASTRKPEKGHCCSYLHPLISIPKSIISPHLFVFFLNLIPPQAVIYIQLSIAGKSQNKHMYSLQIENILGEMEQEHGLDVQPGFKVTRSESFTTTLRLIILSKYFTFCLTYRRKKSNPSREKNKHVVYWLRRD